MKIGFNMLLWTPYVTEEHFYLFEPHKAAGYDGVELALLHAKQVDPQRIMRALIEHGLELPVISTGQVFSEGKRDGFPIL